MLGLTQQYSLFSELTGIITASLAAILFGSLYYSNKFMLPLWHKYSRRDTSKRRPVAIYTLAFIINLVQATVLSKVIGIPATFAESFIRGCIVGFGLSAMGILHNCNFSRQSFAIPLIDGSFEILKCGIMSTMLFAFHSSYLWK